MHQSRLAAVCEDECRGPTGTPVLPCFCFADSVEIGKLRSDCLTSSLVRS